jgi:hypothetical protein
MDSFHIPKVLPPNGRFPIHVESGYLILYVFRVVMDYEVHIQDEYPNFFFFPLLNLSIEGGSFGFIEIFSVMTLGMFPLLSSRLGMGTSFSTRIFLDLLVSSKECSGECLLAPCWAFLEVLLLVWPLSGPCFCISGGLGIFLV